MDLAYTQVARLGLAVEAGRIPTARARLHEALAQTAPDLHPARLPLRLYEAALHLELGQTEAATAALEAAQTHARTPAGQALIATYQALIAGTLSPRRADPRPEERVAVAVARRVRGD